MSAPPANPRRRRVGQPIRPRTQLVIGDWVRRTADGAVFQIRNQYRSEKRIQLAPDLEDTGPVTIPRSELERGFTRVAL